MQINGLHRCAEIMHNVCAPIDQQQTRQKEDKNYKSSEAIRWKTFKQKKRNKKKDHPSTIEK